MASDPKTRLKEWLASGQARLQPLTFPQRELWETSPISPGDPANNIGSFFEIRGAITLEEFEAAVEKIVERQEVMRTSILPGKERPLQIIRSTGETVIHYHELSESESEPETLEAIMAERVRVPFDLVRGPLYRLDLLRRGPEDFLFVVTTHHAIADGWSLGVFIDDLCSAYITAAREKGRMLGKINGIRESLPPPQTTYSKWGADDRAIWQPGELDRHAEFWKKRLSGSKLLFDDSKRHPGESVPLKKWITSISPELSNATRELARRAGVTPFSAFLTAFQLALHRWSGSDDITVGSPIANRGKSSVRETMGYFSGVVPLRAQIDTAQSFSDRLKYVHEETVDSFAHAMPFAELAGALGESSRSHRHTLFDVRFAFQNHPVPDVVLPGVSTKLKVWSTGTARFDIACEMTEDAGGYEVVWLYQTQIVSETELRELNQLFQAVLTQVCSRPEITAQSLKV